MQYDNLDYDSELGLLSLLTDNHVRIGTVFQDPNPIELGYSLARFSRNKLGHKYRDILRDVRRRVVSASQRTEAILSYGHSSVQGLGHFVCVFEGASIFDSLLYFYHCRLQDGQETSTRYVNFAAIPEGDMFLIDPDTPLLREYQEILYKQRNDYLELMSPTEAFLADMYNIPLGDATLKARTFDCLRYLLPLGTKTAFGGVQSGREWSHYIKRLFIEGQEALANGLVSLLKSKKGMGVSTLIRHYNPQEHEMNGLYELMDCVVINNLHSLPSQYPYISTPDLASKLCALIYPRRKPDYQINVPALSKALSKWDNHSSLGPVAQGGQYTLEGLLDLGSLKDLNRHRSAEVFIPLLHKECNMKQELEGEQIYNIYRVCPYLEGSTLGEDYTRRLSDTYHLVRHWFASALRYFSSSKVFHYSKRLIPQAHLTRYCISGSLEDWNYLIRQRIRPGGHIAYRYWAHECAKTLADYSPLFQGLLDSIQSPSLSREEFLDRS